MFLQNVTVYSLVGLLVCAPNARGKCSPNMGDGVGHGSTIARGLTIIFKCIGKRICVENILNPNGGSLNFMQYKIFGMKA